MASKKALALLNEQITHEFYAAFLYLNMGIQCEHDGLKGFANWFFIQHQEEHTHAMNIVKYLNDKGEKVEMKSIPVTKTQWKDPMEMFKDALAAEKEVTKQFNDMMEASYNDKDYATASFLKWYVDEQVEEEASFQEIIDKLKMVGVTNGLYMLDKELAARVFTSTLVAKATPAKLA